MSELRWDARRGEWVIVAPHRQDRTYHPPADHCPFCPTRGDGPPTEIPFETFDIAVFENRFPSMAGAGATPVGADGRSGERVRGERDPGVRSAQRPIAAPPAHALHVNAPAAGRCEVVVYTPEHEGSLGGLPVRRIERLIRVWAQRYRELSALDGVRHVLIFENRGAEIGVTLPHPHGQIYAYPFVPPVPARARARERAYAVEAGGCLHCDLRAREEAADERVVAACGDVVAYVPFAARWPFETHVVPRAHRPSLLALEPAERRDLARALRRVLTAYDALFGRPMPYVLAVRQAFAADAVGPGSHVRIELYPARRAPDKLKHRAGSELSMGAAVHDLGPERAAARLREVVDA